MHTATVDVNQAHNVVFFDGITLAEAAEKAVRVTEVKPHGDLYWKRKVLQTSTS